MKLKGKITYLMHQSFSFITAFPQKLLKVIETSKSKFITHSFDLGNSTSGFLTALTMAIVKSVFKNNTRPNKANYRSVILFLVISKVYER